MISTKNEGVKPSTILMGFSIPTFLIALIMPTLTEQSISEEGYYVGHPLLTSINGFGWLSVIGIFVLTIINITESYKERANRILMSITLIFYFLLSGIVLATPDNSDTFERAEGYYFFFAALIFFIAGSFVSRISIKEKIIFGGPTRPPIDDLPSESPSGIKEKRF